MWMVELHWRKFSIMSVWLGCLIVRGCLILVSLGLRWRVGWLHCDRLGVVRIL